MDDENTNKSWVINGYTNASIRYGIRSHRYDRVKCRLIETNLIFSTFELVRVLYQLTFACFVTLYMGAILAFSLILYFYEFLLFIALIFFYGGIEFFLIALELCFEQFILWLLSNPGLCFLGGLVVIFSIITIMTLTGDMFMLGCNAGEIVDHFRQLVIFPFIALFNLFSLVSNTIYSCAYYLMDYFESRPAHECLVEYLNEHPEIKNICLDLELDNTLDLKQLRNVMDLIPPSVESIKLCISFSPSCSEETRMNLFKAVNSINREKVSFNTQELTDKWEAWQSAHIFYTLEQTSAPGRPRLNQDVIRFGIFSYLEPSDMNAMFDGLCPPPASPAF